jgi:hypothetical protein
MTTINFQSFFISFFCIAFTSLLINTSSLDSLNNKNVVGKSEVTSVSSSFIFISAKELTKNNLEPENGTLNSNPLKIKVCNNSYGGGGCTLDSTSCGGCDSEGNHVCCQVGYETCPYWITDEIKVN